MSDSSKNLQKIFQFLMFVGVIGLISFLIINYQENKERKESQFFSYICKGIIVPGDNNPAGRCHDKLLEVSNGDYELGDYQVKGGLTGDLSYVDGGPKIQIEK